MKKLIVLSIIIYTIIFPSPGQNRNTANTSYNYYSSPGFVNIAEISGAYGLGDTEIENSIYYFGATNIFGYQVDRNFLCGIGLGFFMYDHSALIPVFAEIRYTTYLKAVNPYFFADGGLLIDPGDPYYKSKIFINPGLGLSRSITPKIEFTLGAGLMIQMGAAVYRASYANFRAGLIIRKNGMRLYKAGGKSPGYCPY